MQRLVGLLLFAVCLGLLPGCGLGKKPTGTVSGVVRYKGAPVPGGLINFVGADGRPQGTQIGEDGSYTVHEVAVGPAKVSVDNRLLQMLAQTPGKPPGGPSPKDAPPQDAPARPPGRYVPLPPTVADPEKSGIVCQVQTGEQIFAVDLK